MKSNNTSRGKSKKYRKTDFKDDDYFEIQTKAEDSVITDQDLVGSVYCINDDFWNFQYSGREDHPGACLYVKEKLNKAILVHGTDSNSYIAQIYHNISYIIEPDSLNGLTKTTAFILKSHYIRCRKLALYHINRKIGCLADKDVIAMRDHIVQDHPDPWEDDS